MVRIVENRSVVPLAVQKRSSVTRVSMQTKLSSRRKFALPAENVLTAENQPKKIRLNRISAEFLRKN